MRRPIPRDRGGPPARPGGGSTRRKAPRREGPVRLSVAPGPLPVAALPRLDLSLSGRGRRSEPAVVYRRAAPAPAGAVRAAAAMPVRSVAVSAVAPHLLDERVVVGRRDCGHGHRGGSRQLGAAEREQETGEEG